MKHFAKLWKCLLNTTNKVVSSISILAIYFYRLMLSPYLGGNCRFNPSCSEYAEQAYKNHNFILATNLVLRRLSKCHPFGPFGYDPVPDLNKDKLKECYAKSR